MSKKKVLFTVNGFQVLEDTVYRLRQKKDPSAPEEMQERGLSKYPGAPTTIKCKFLENSNIYDTGFEESSVAFLYMDKSDVKKEVKDRRENVLKPFLNMRGLTEDRFKPSSLEDWDELSVKLSTDAFFNTSDIKDRMSLYIALTTYSVVPPDDDEYDYKYDTASYVLENSEIKNKVTTDNQRAKMRANAKFVTLLDSDKEALLDILVFLGKKELRAFKGDESVLVPYAESFVLKTVHNTERFLEVAEKLGTNEGSKELRVFRKIVNGLEGNDPRFVRKSGDVIFETTVLGKSEIEAAKKVSTNKNLEEILEKILFN